MVVHYCAKEPLSAAALLAKITESKIFASIALNVSHVETIVHLLENDERLVRAGAADQWTSLSFERVGASLTRVPCFGCPRVEDCAPIGRVSPATCEYLREWLAPQTPPVAAAAAAGVDLTW